MDGSTGNTRDMPYQRLDESGRRSLDIEAIRRGLRTHIFAIGERLQYIPVIDSTNTLAMRLAREEAVREGTVILTDSQTAGKGRLGRRWIDAFGYNVLSSTVLRPRFPLYLLVMLASLAVVHTIDDLFETQQDSSPQAAIKWPNDVLISERKVAGILVETSHDRSGHLIAILGIGVNVLTLPLSSTSDGYNAIGDPDTVSSLLERATTLETAYGHAVSREAFIARLVEHLEAIYFALQRDTEDPQHLTDLVDQTVHQENIVQLASRAISASRLLRERWRERLTTVGRTVQVRQGNTLIEGVAEDVDENGELLLRRHSGERVTITWGDIGYPINDLTPTE